MENNTTIIYRIYNTETNKNYIGKTNRDLVRWEEHFTNKNNPFQEDLDKHGYKSFEFSVLEELIWSDETYILEIEQTYMDEYNVLEEWYNRRENFRKEETDKMIKFSKSIYNTWYDNLINLSCVRDVVASYHVWQEILNILETHKKLSDNRRWFELIKDKSEIFFKEWVIDSINYNLIKYSMIYLRDSSITEDKRYYIEQLNSLEVIKFDFYEEKSERNERILELFERWYKTKEINKITWIKNSIIDNVIRLFRWNYVKWSIIKYKKRIKFDLFWYTFNLNFNIKK